jgi:hypothetical protein
MDLMYNIKTKFPSYFRDDEEIKIAYVACTRGKSNLIILN